MAAVTICSLVVPGIALLGAVVFVVIGCWDARVAAATFIFTSCLVPGIVFHYFMYIWSSLCCSPTPPNASKHNERGGGGGGGGVK